MLLKDGTIVLDNFQIGQAESPHFGFGRIQCADILDTPGVAKIQRRTDLKYTVTGLPMAIEQDVNGNEYVGTDQGYLYKNGSVISSSLGIIYDLKVYQNYLLITRQTVVDVYGPLDNVGAQLFNSWKTGLTSGYYKKIVIDPDNDVWIGNAGSVAKITGSTFTAGAVGVAPTATLVTAEKDLPEGQYVRTMAMVGILLGIGTQAGSGYLDFSYGVGNIYFWDRASSLFEDNVLEFKESGIHQILNTGSSLIVHAGIYGNVYETNGVSAGDPVKTIKFNNDNNATVISYPNAIGKIGSEIVIGTSTGNDGFPSVSTHGVWSLKRGSASLRNVISTDNVGVNQVLKIGAIFSVNSGINRNVLIGWQDGSTYGVDQLSGSYPYDDYQTVIESELHRVGTYFDRGTYNELEITLAKPLVAGQTIEVAYRKNLTDDYTVIGTYTTSNTDADEVSILDPNISLAELIFCQVRVRLKQAITLNYLNNIHLREVRIKNVTR
jgi:hypothetical protein